MGASVAISGCSCGSAAVMILLLARLGLRAPEVIAIQLDDIDWRDDWSHPDGYGYLDHHGSCHCGTVCFRVRLTSGSHTALPRPWVRILRCIALFLVLKLVILVQGSIVLLHHNPAGFIGVDDLDSPTVQRR